MSKFLKLDTDKRYFLEVDKIINEYSEFYMNAEDSWDNMWEFLIEQIFITLWFGFLSLAAFAIFLTLFFEYVLNSQGPEMFWDNLYLISSIWAFFVLVITTNRQLKKLKKQITEDNLEIGIQMYRQNLYHAKNKLKPIEFKKLIEKECDTGKLEVFMQAIDDYKYGKK